MKIGIVRERRAHEARIAASPETVKKLIALGATVTVEAGAGASAAYGDDAYVAAGATIAPDEAAALVDESDLAEILRGFEEWLVRPTVSPVPALLPSE